MTSRHTSRKTSRKTRTCCSERLEREATFARELSASAASVLAHARSAPDAIRARLLADVLVPLMAAPPPALAALAARVSEADRARAPNEGVGAIASMLWRRAQQLDALSPDRALALARRLSPCIDEDAVLLCFAADAHARGLADAARVLDDALDTRSPNFRARAADMPVTRALLRAAGIALEEATPEHGALEVRFHRDGHLARVAGAGRVLVLDAKPGSGQFREDGKAGGYGFAVRERYEDGAARGTLSSPWHDGEEYATAKPWLVWVLECVATVRDAVRDAARARGAPDQPRRVRARRGRRAR